MLANSSNLTAICDIFYYFLINLPTSAAACCSARHQQTQQLSNKLNFISAQLIITFSSRMLRARWHDSEKKLRHGCHPMIPNEYFDVLSVLHMATFYVTSVAGYQVNFLVNIPAFRTECEIVFRLLHLFLESLSSFNFHAFLQYQRRRPPAELQWKHSVPWCV